MELREFAEQILFATTLDEKLRCPDKVTDERPGSALTTPAAPGRPKELQFKVTGEARDSFPGTKNLERESERGRLLHFFANHELLATELMALVLLQISRCARRVPPGCVANAQGRAGTHAALPRTHEGMRHPFWRTAGEWLFLALCFRDGESDGLRLQPVPDLRAGEPGFRAALCSRLRGGRRRHHGRVARKNLPRRNRPCRPRPEMVSPLEKSERKRLGGILPPIEISAVAATGQRHLAECRRPARRRIRRAIHRRAGCVFAIQRPHAECFCLQSVCRSAHRARQIVQSHEASGATCARFGKPAAVSLPTGRHCLGEIKNHRWNF